MSFLTESEPPRGVALDVLPGIKKVVARNPSVMTYHGTNTYLIEDPQGITVLDPGPEDAEHVGDVVRAAAGRPIIRIVLTHAHPDHHGAAAALQQATGAPSWGYARSGMPQQFVADHGLDDGDEVAGLQAVFTPGHAPDHLSFAYQVPGIGQVLFSGDHVMSWSSSIVNPPMGSMRAYYSSLELLLARDDVFLLPGHGPIGTNPKALVQDLLRHRKMREAAIWTALEGGPVSVGDIAARLYDKTEESLKMAARRNVLAHLLKLQEEGRAIQLQQDGSLAEAAFLETDDREKLMASYMQMAAKDAERKFMRNIK